MRQTALKQGVSWMNERTTYYALVASQVWFLRLTNFESRVSTQPGEQRRRPGRHHGTKAKLSSSFSLSSGKSLLRFCPKANTQHPHISAVPTTLKHAAAENNTGLEQVDGWGGQIEVGQFMKNKESWIKNGFIFWFLYSPLASDL